MSTKENLIKARDLLSEHYGFAQLYDSATGCYCALGAIQAACGLPHVYTDALNDLPEVQAVASKLPGALRHDAIFRQDYERIYRFNDDKGRHAMLKVFDKAIAALED